MIAEYCTGVIAGRQLGITKCKVSFIVTGRIDNPFKDFTLQYKSRDHTLGSPVVQVTANGSIVEEFESVTQAMKKLSLTRVGDVCNGKLDHVHGYYFKWKRDCTSSSRFFCRGSNCICRRAPVKSVISTSKKSGNVIAEYCSLSVTAVELEVGNIFALMDVVLGREI